MVKLSEVYFNAKQTLKDSKIENYAFEVRELIKRFLKLDVRLNMEKQIDENELSEFNKALEKRAENYPLQYILGEWEFYSLPFKVGEGVLIPRQDTEILVETAIQKFKEKENINIIDLCAGSGAIAISVEKNLSCKSVIAVEYLPNAKKYLDENIILNNSKVKSILGDVLDDKLIESFDTFDLILSNPPYLTKREINYLQKEVEYEPKEALFGGGDGLLFYQFIIRKYKDKLNKSGYLMVEIGYEQGKDVSDIFIQNGYKNVRIIKDYSSNDRVVIGQNDDWFYSDL